MPAGRVSRSAAYYDEYWSSGGFSPGQAIPCSLREILERWARPTDTCLDVGCGRGEGPGAWLAAHTRSYVGTDVSEAALEVARAAGLEVRQIEDASELPFPDSSFDLTVCLEVLEHLVEPQLAAGEILRALRPGGRLIVSVPNVAHWRRRADLAVLGRWNPMGDDQAAHRPWRDPHLRFFGRANLVRMLEEQGFQTLASGGFGASWMTDLPVVRGLMRDRDPGPVYRRLIRFAPALFAQHLYGIFEKPAVD